MLIGVLNLAAILTWMERKQSAVMQDRIGANRATILGFRMFGLFQILADGLKMFVKEDFIPAEGNRFLHGLAPFVAAFFALVGFAAIPFGSTVNLFGREIPLQIIDLNVGVLYIFAVMSLGDLRRRAGRLVFKQQLRLPRRHAGKFADVFLRSYNRRDDPGRVDDFRVDEFAGNRAGTGRSCCGALSRSGAVIVQPLGCILFLVAGIAETKRIPFDLPEGESEIIGFFVEYSSMKFGLFMLTDFVETVLIAALVTTLFFGGWQVPT